jgi:hypothetical protein
VRSATGWAGPALGKSLRPIHNHNGEKYVMATNKPIGDSARKGAVKKRSQLATKTMGKKTFTKRNKEGGQFMAQKKKSKFKGVRKER